MNSNNELNGGKVVLYVKEELKRQLTANADNILASLKNYKSQLEEFLGKEVSAEGVIKSIEDGSKESTSLFTKSNLFTKHQDSIEKFKEQFPGIQTSKALENFTANEDLEQIEGLLNEIQKLNEDFKQMKMLVREIELEHFILHDKLEINSKVTSRIKSATQVLAKSKNQIKIKKLVEEMSKLIKDGIEDKTLSNNRLGVTVDKIIDTGNGKINWNMIQRY